MVFFIYLAIYISIKIDLEIYKKIDQLVIFISLFIEIDWLSVVIGVLGATFVWGSTELKEQAVRTEIGWYPFNKNKIRSPFENLIRKWKAPHL